MNIMEQRKWHWFIRVLDSSKTSGTYLDPLTSKELDKECSIINFSIELNIKQWQAKICDQFEAWLSLPE